MTTAPALRGLARPPALLVLEDGRTFRGHGLRRRGGVLRRGRVQHRHDRLPGDAHRPQLPPPGRGDDGAAHRQHRGQRRPTPSPTGSGSRGFVVRDPARVPSSWRSQRTLDAELVAQGVVGVAGIDTRALTRHLRERGAMRCAVSSTERDPEALLERVLASPGMAGADLVGDVTCAAPYVVAPPAGTPDPLPGGRGGPRPQAGHPALPRRGRAARSRSCPPPPPPQEILARDPDGVFFSNGPGDPATADRVVRTVEGVLGQVPVFGICFGNQLLGRALGLGTYKLRYGHRGVNSPVQDRATGPGARHQPQPRLRPRRPARRALRHPVRPGRGQPHLPQRRCRRGRALPRRAGVQRPVPPRGGPRTARRHRAVRPVRRPDEHLGKGA